MNQQVSRGPTFGLLLAASLLQLFIQTPHNFCQPARLWPDDLVWNCLDHLIQKFALRRPRWDTIEQDETGRANWMLSRQSHQRNCQHREGGFLVLPHNKEIVSTLLLEDHF